MVDLSGSDVRIELCTGVNNKVDRSSHQPAWLDTLGFTMPVPSVPFEVDDMCMFPILHVLFFFGSRRVYFEIENEGWGGPSNRWRMADDIRRLYNAITNGIGRERFKAFAEDQFSDSFVHFDPSEPLVSESGESLPREILPFQIGEFELSQSHPWANNGEGAEEGARKAVRTRTRTRTSMQMGTAA